MLQLGSSLINKPVLSLQTGSPIGTAYSLLFDPSTLKIIGLHCKDRFTSQHMIVLSQDIRDIMDRGYVVNDHNVLTPLEDLVRYQKLLDLDFQLMGKVVVTDKKKRLGKVTDYAVEKETLYVQKIYVGQSLLKSFSGGQLSVDRGQITEITPKKIIIQDPLQFKAAPSAVQAA